MNVALPETGGGSNIAACDGGERAVICRQPERTERAQGGKYSVEIERKGIERRQHRD